MNYEVWDVATGNCIGRYGAEEAALARVRDLLSRFGPDYAQDLELVGENPAGSFLGSRSGASLLARAETTAIAS